MTFNDADKNMAVCPKCNTMYVPHTRRFCAEDGIRLRQPETRSGRSAVFTSLISGDERSDREPTTPELKAEPAVQQPLEEVELEIAPPKPRERKFITLEAVLDEKPKRPPVPVIEPVEEEDDDLDTGNLPAIPLPQSLAQSEPVVSNKPSAVDTFVEDEEDAEPIIESIPVQEISVEPPARVDEEPVTENAPGWTKRSPEPLKTGNSRWILFSLLGLVLLGGIVFAGWALLLNRQPQEPGLTAASVPERAVPEASNPTVVENTEFPPMARKIAQPPATKYFETLKQNVKGDLLRNFVGFSVYIPESWKMNGPTASEEKANRGKFIDASSTTDDGLLKEQILVSYYPSDGTFKSDEDKFASLVDEANQTLDKIVPNYQLVSQGEVTVNGWRGYEMKFKFGGTRDDGEEIMVYGRRIFIPSARPGVRNGFEVTMLASSHVEGVRSVDDVAVKGQLASVLETFEPGQNF